VRPKCDRSRISMTRICMHTGMTEMREPAKSIDRPSIDCLSTISLVNDLQNPREFTRCRIERSFTVFFYVGKLSNIKQSKISFKTVI